MSLSEAFVLVVEDDMLLRFDLVDAFEHAGFAVLDASNADEALAMLTGRVIAALVTDVQMPGCLDGLGLAEIASMLDAERPLVICTGHPLPTLGRTPPGSLILQKPCAPDVVVSAVSAALRARADSGRTDPSAAA
ncbi:response regulator [Salinarimonas ramus]|uniref:Response regulatory domain-containing protein n=1 Tax=Salinarimonas ramus TaxID=690164 RepID=A0A917Q640_9HYPH|nr:response regulator [Salinarimonas ramus]GGK21014.1 hypothetical protein GCM10011322_04560 [Salinarimonas ramus]